MPDQLTAALHDLARCRTAADVHRVLIRKTRAALGADGATLAVRDGDVCHYVAEDAISRLFEEQRLPLTACMSGWCITKKQRLTIEDITVDERVPRGVYEHTFVRSLAIAPIGSTDPIGALGAYWAAKHHPSKQDLLRLQALADAAAIAFENVSLIAALEQANRQKEAFLALLAHELRNPLGTLRTTIAAFKIRSVGTGDLDLADILDRQSAHLARLLDDLLDLARMNTGKLRLESSEFDIVKQLSDIVVDLKPAFVRSGVTFEFAFPREQLLVDADSARIYQAIGNLLDNARKFSTPGGSVKLSVAREGDNVRIDVSDTGLGIPPAMLPRIFDPFLQGDTTIKRSAGGLGIGLSIAKALVELHGGMISVASEGPNRGACFTVRLPLKSVVRDSEGNVFHITLTAAKTSDTAKGDAR